ncbi:GH12402 [Drosophila grimshawi]|uniref:nicotinate phosphoribosyltransferase n=1 Tax=Drosophila grimshawi TaxID=7222 RepID=B4K2G7_DROGR|nr:GH12402 [Drosophila grimshawi]
MTQWCRMLFKFMLSPILCASGFDGTSNVLAGKLFNIPVKGTHAHAYITSFSSVGELKTRLLKHKQTGVMEDLLEHAIRHRQMLSHVLDVSTEESKVAERFKVPWFNKLTIVASNDINEDTILSLNEQGHKIDCFGIGTHLVTCQRQPALGCVYKLVEINGQARIKLSQDVEKVTMPGNKNAYRLYSADGHALIDLLQKDSEHPPAVGQKVLCRHPFQESKRAYVIPSHVESLYKIYWKAGKICQMLPTLEQVREKVQISLKTLRNDHKRTLNPTPYKVKHSPTIAYSIFY